MQGPASSGFFGGGMDTMSPGSALLVTLLICVGLYLLVGTAYAPPRTPAHPRIPTAPQPNGPAPPPP